jgi:hypothetical protein
MGRGERGGVERKSSDGWGGARGAASKERKSSSGIGEGGNTTQGAKLPGPRQKIKLWLPLGCGGR